jgi:HAE1 family hydrophobic/amphiphilic exporter-1
MNTPRLFVEIEAGERPPKRSRKCLSKAGVDGYPAKDVTQVLPLSGQESARVRWNTCKIKIWMRLFSIFRRLWPVFQNQDIESVNITQHDPIWRRSC